MNKLIPLLLLSTSANAGWFEFNQESWTGYETDIPDTSYDYYYGENLSYDEPNNGNFTDIVNSTTMKLYKGDEWLQTIFGVSFLYNKLWGVYDSYDGWHFRGAGNYTIVVEVHLEHNDKTPYGCNLGSDCYVPSDESYVEVLTDTLVVVILSDINNPEPPYDLPTEPAPEPHPTPVMVAETPFEAPVVDYKPSLPPTYAPVTPEVIVINAEDWEGETGSLSWWTILAASLLFRHKNNRHTLFRHFN